MVGLYIMLFHWATLRKAITALSVLARSFANLPLLC